MVVIAAVLVLGRRWDGSARVAALAATVALVAAPLAALTRFAYLYTIAHVAGAGQPPNLVVAFWFRYAQLAGLVTIVPSSSSIGAKPAVSR